MLYHTYTGYFPSTLLSWLFPENTWQMTQTVNMITTRPGHFAIKIKIVHILQEEKHQSTNENRKQRRFVDAAPSLQTCMLIKRLKRNRFLRWHSWKTENNNRKIKWRNNRRQLIIIKQNLLLWDQVSTLRRTVKSHHLTVWLLCFSFIVLLSWGYCRSFSSAMLSSSSSVKSAEIKLRARKMNLQIKLQQMWLGNIFQ